MRNPNGFGSVYKLTGKRRNPWAARITRGYDDRGYPIYNFVGYYKTKSDALIALADYNKHPFNLDVKKITVAEVFNKYISNEFNTLTASVIKQRRTAFNYLQEVAGIPYNQIKLPHMQSTFSGATPATQRQIKNLWSALDSYALQIDIISKRYSDLLKVQSVYQAKEKQPITPEEIALIWQYRGNLEIDITLVLLYTGLRVNELLPLPCSAVDFKQNSLTAGSKTAAGKNRLIPIHPKILPIIKERAAGSKTGLLFETARNSAVTYGNFKVNMWTKLPGDIGQKYTPHATRHTLRSDLDRAGANKVAIDKIMGHATGGTGEIVYTHKTIEDLRAAIMKISF